MKKNKRPQPVKNVEKEKAEEVYILRITRLIRVRGISKVWYQYEAKYTNLCTSIKSGNRNTQSQFIFLIKLQSIKEDILNKKPGTTRIYVHKKSKPLVNITNQH